MFISTISQKNTLSKVSRFLQSITSFSFLLLPGAANMVTGPTRSLWQIVKTYMATKNYNPLGLMPENKMAAGYHLGHLVDNIELIRECAIELLKLYTEGKIKPVIDSQWSFEEVCQFENVLYSAVVFTETHLELFTYYFGHLC